MTHFKNALLDELITYAQEPAPAIDRSAARPRKLVRMAGLTTAGVVATVATALLVSSNAQAAYAVNKHPNGTVTITFRELGHAAEATHALRAAGVPAQVVQLAAPGSCATTPGGEPIANYRPSGPPPYFYRVGVPPEYPGSPEPSSYLTISQRSLTVNPAEIPTGAVLFILENFKPGDGINLAADLTAAPAPTCWEASVTRHPRRS